MLPSEVRILPPQPLSCLTLGKLMESKNGRLLVFSGRAHTTLANEICQYIDIPLGKSVTRDFSDSEIYVRIEENVRGGDVFLIQPTCNPGNTNLMELLIMIGREI